MSRLTQGEAGRSDNNEAEGTPYPDASMARRIRSMSSIVPGGTLVGIPAIHGRCARPRPQVDMLIRRLASPRVGCHHRHPEHEMEMQFFFSLQISFGFTEVEIPFSMTGRSKGTDRNLSRKPSMAI